MFLGFLEEGIGVEFNVAFVEAQVFVEDVSAGCVVEEVFGGS